MTAIKLWAQMFFDDGSISQGLRIDASYLEDEEKLAEVVNMLLNSVNRKEGYVLFWGAGNVVFRYYDLNVFPLRVLKISVSES